jgi:hypothetical protein
MNQRTNTKLPKEELSPFHELHVHRSTTSEVEIVRADSLRLAVEQVKDRIGLNDLAIVGLEVYSVMPLSEAPGWAVRKLIQEWSRT